MDESSKMPLKEDAKEAEGIVEENKNTTEDPQSQ